MKGENLFMDKGTKKLVDAAVTEFFKNAPEKMVERSVREVYYDICPHCKKEISERMEYTEDGGTTWRHSDCKRLIARPETPLEEVGHWLRPYVKEAQLQRQAARYKLGLAEPPSDEPGGTMMAVNVEEVDYRTDKEPNGYPEDSGKFPESPADIPGSKEHRPLKIPIALHPRPHEPPEFQVNEMQNSENEESKPVGARDFSRFANNMMNFVNASNIPLKVTVSEFTAMVDGQLAKTYIVKVDNV